MRKVNVTSLSEHVRQTCTITVDDVFNHLLPAYGWCVTDYGVKESGKKHYTFQAGKYVVDTRRKQDVIRERYAYRPGRADSSVCLVVHADTVLADLSYVYDVDNAVVTSSELDDRLGLAILTDAIERKSVLSQCAMLVCDNEEIGQSTASIFADDTMTKPNWLMEFDRRGSDVVCYEYENETLTSLLEHVGFTIGSGSFSDICRMGSLEVSGVNVGVGYHREHSTHCYACLNDTVSQVAKAELLVKQFGHVTLKHKTRYTSRGYRYGITSTSKTNTASSQSLSLPDDVDWWRYRDYAKAPSTPLTPPTLPTLPVNGELARLSFDDDIDNDTDTDDIDAALKDAVFCQVCGTVCRKDDGDEPESEWCLDCIHDVCDDDGIDGDTYTGIPTECTSCGEWCTGEHTFSHMPVCLACQNAHMKVCGNND